MHGSVSRQTSSLSFISRLWVLGVLRPVTRVTKNTHRLGDEERRLMHLVPKDLPMFPTLGLSLVTTGAQESGNMMGEIPGDPMHGLDGFYYQ